MNGQVRGNRMLREIHETVIRTEVTLNRAVTDIVNHEKRLGCIEGDISKGKGVMAAGVAGGGIIGWMLSKVLGSKL